MIEIFGHVACCITLFIVWCCQDLLSFLQLLTLCLIPFSAEPVVRGEMSHLPEGSVFIYCQVGERA